MRVPDLHEHAHVRDLGVRNPESEETEPARGVLLEAGQAQLREVADSRNLADSFQDRAFQDSGFQVVAVHLLVSTVQVRGIHGAEDIRQRHDLDVGVHLLQLVGETHRQRLFIRLVRGGGRRGQEADPAIREVVRAEADRRVFRLVFHLVDERATARQHGDEQDYR